MKAQLIDLSFFLGKQRLLVEIDTDFREKFERLRGKEVEVRIEEKKEGRSIQANNYFHHLVNAIANEKARRGFNETNDVVKKQLVVDYGTLATDDKGGKIGFKLPASVDVDEIYPYTKWFDTREEDGQKFNCYLVYKQTHTMNTAEMCRLIDGAVQEAKDLGLETDTPEQLAKYKAQWSAKENKC